MEVDDASTLAALERKMCERDEMHLQILEHLQCENSGYPKTATFSVSSGHHERFLHADQEENFPMF